MKFVDIDLDNNGTWYTDSNSLQMVQRNKKFDSKSEPYNPYANAQRDYRKTLYTLGSTEELAENTYPLTSAMRIYDKNSERQMFVTVDRPQGGTSLTKGSLEVFQNRRISTLDNKGLGESYNELENGEGIHTNNTYYLGLMPTNCSNAQRRLQLGIQDPPQVLVAQADIKEDQQLGNLVKPKTLA